MKPQYSKDYKRKVTSQMLFVCDGFYWTVAQDPRRKRKFVTYRSHRRLFARGIPLTGAVLREFAKTLDCDLIVHVKLKPERPIWRNPNHAST